MAWLISKALMTAYENSHCSQELGAKSSADTCSDGGQSALSSGRLTPQAYCASDKMTEFSLLSRFGMTFAPLTDVRGDGLLTWYLAGFRARTYPSQEQGQESTAIGRACGEKWPALLAKYDPDSCAWKTAQCSLIEDSGECLETWPRSGMTRNGASYQRPMLELTTSGSGSGLSDTVWPTPTVCGNYNRKGASKTSGDGLATAVKKAMWPTPQASDNRDRGNLSTPSIARRIEKGKQVMLSMCVSSENGRLNPEWVEWLMGWPAGWTDLKPSETAKFHEWQRQHSPCFGSEQDGNEAAQGTDGA